MTALVGCARRQPAREYGRLSVRSDVGHDGAMAAAPEVTLLGRGLPAAPNLPSAALARLPETAGQADPFWRLAAAFLVGYPPATARAYLGDLRAWIGWCTDQGVHPFTARRHHVDHWARHLAAVPQPATEGWSVATISSMVDSLMVAVPVHGRRVVDPRGADCLLLPTSRMGSAGQRMSRVSVCSIWTACS